MPRAKTHHPLPLTIVDLRATLGTQFQEVTTDGLPLASVSMQEVQTLLRTFNATGSEVVGTFPPLYADVTLHGLAVFSLLAGAPSSIFPAVVAAARAVADPAFNLLAVQTTTSAVGVATVLCGSDLKQMGFFEGSNASGAAVMANVTLGRAIRLALINIGGATPDMLDPASLGWPGKISFTIVENTDATPWPHTRDELMGASQNDTSIMIVAPANGFIELTDSKSGTGSELLASFARMLCFSPETARSDEALIVLTPHHAELLARSGRSKADVQKSVALAMGLSDTGKVIVIVSGGTGGKSASVPLWGESRCCVLPFSHSSLTMNQPVRPL